MVILYHFCCLYIPMYLGVMYAYSRQGTHYLQKMLICMNNYERRRSRYMHSSNISKWSEVIPLVSYRSKWTLFILKLKNLNYDVGSISLWLTWGNQKKSLVRHINYSLIQKHIFAYFKNPQVVFLKWKTTHRPFKSMQMYVFASDNS